MVSRTRAASGNRYGRSTRHGVGCGTCVVEGLEGRTYMAGTPVRLEEVVAEGGKQLVIHGTSGADNIRVLSKDGRLTVRNGTWSRTVSHVYDSVVVSGRGGNDLIAV